MAEPGNTTAYNDRQRLGFLRGWNGWTDEIRQLVDRAIEDRRAQAAGRGELTADEVNSECCVDCNTPLVPCDCREGCMGGKCPVCLCEDGTENR